MRQSSTKIIILLQLFLYLLGGHATAHGLAWCISADGHAHVASAAGCVSEQDELACATAGYCVSAPDEIGSPAHAGTECRHLPVTSPHANSVASAQKVESGSIVAIAPAISPPALRYRSAAVYRQTAFPAAVELPRPLALVSLRTIVLLI